MNRPRFSIVPTTIVALLLSRSLAAAPSGEGSEPIYLKSPDRINLDARTNRLRSADLNGDGRPDIVTIDDNQNLLVMMMSTEDEGAKDRELRLEDDGKWVWRDQKIVLPGQATSLELGDVTGDQKADVIIATAAGQLLVYRQGKAGIDEEPDRLSESATVMEAADLNGDDLLDLVLGKGTDIVTMLQDAKTGLQVAGRQASSVAMQSPIVLQDMDGDKVLDLMMNDTADAKVVILRSGLGDGTFGPETRSSLVDHGTLVGLSKGQIALLDPTTRAICIAALRPPVRAAAADRLPVSDAKLLPVPSDVSGSRYSLATLPSVENSIVVGPSKGARLLHLRRDSEGHLSWNDLSSYLGTRDVAVNGERLLVVSDREGMLASFDASDAESLDHFPEPIGLEETPLTITTAPLAKGGNTYAWIVVRPEDDDEVDMVVRVMEIGDEGKATEVAQLTFEETADEEPEKLVVADFTGDGLSDALLMLQDADALLMVQTPEKAFESVDGSRGTASSLLTGLHAANLAVMQSEDGPAQLIVARGDTVRFFGLSADGAVTIHRQLSPPTRGARVALPILADVDGDGAKDVIVLQEPGTKLVGFSGGNADAPAWTLEIPKLDAKVGLAADVNGDEKDDLIYMDGTRLALFEAGSESKRLQSLSQTLTDVDDGLFGAIDSGPLLAGDHAPVLFAVEQRENLLHFYTANDDGSLKMRYRFRVFDYPRSMDSDRLRRMTPEPRTFCVVDINSDGLPDLLALSHTNLLVYRQTDEAPKP